ncbi:MAG TPA: hypothetical protein VKA41_11770 [Solirubrobacterales bacterium]|nr:hypothetical protein [Solirubrobacterales bacterium]
MSKGRQLNGQISGDQDVLTREDTLRILSEMTRKRGDGEAGRADHEQDPDPPRITLRGARADRRGRAGAHLVSRTPSTFSSDIAYSVRPTASRASW